MKIKSFRYIFPQAFKSLRANGWMTFASIMTVTIALFLCTMFWLMIINIDANARDFESDVRVLAYIREDTEKEDYQAIQTRIEGIEGVVEIEYIDKEDGLDDLEKVFEVDLRDTLPEGSNPLPDAFSIMASSTDAVEAIAKSVDEIPQIETVNYGGRSVEMLFALTDTMRQIGIAVMVLLGIAAVVLVAMTIRLTVVARRKEIMVMKWVGATNAFIRWPFFLEGMILGLSGSVLALSLVLLSYQNATQWLLNTVNFITILDFSTIWFTTSIFTLGAGILMGIFGSILSLGKFLNV